MDLYTLENSFILMGMSIYGAPILFSPTVISVRRSMAGVTEFKALYWTSANIDHILYLKLYIFLSRHKL